MRTRGTPARIAEQVRQRLQREMPGTSFITITPLEDIVDATLRSWIVGTAVFTSFGALALALAAIGVYSVIAYNVVQRQHELGVRLALGASRSGVVQLVIMDGIRVALAGLLIGMIVAALVGRWIGPLLFRQSPHDPVVFAVVAVVLFGVAVVASGIPAVRAARADPKTALLAD